MHKLTFTLVAKEANCLAVRGSRRIDNKKVLEFLGTGKIDPVIDRVLPLSEAAKAHETLENQEQFGKIVLVPG